MVLLGIGWFGVQVFWGFHNGSVPLFLKNFTDSKFMISLILSLPGVAGCIVPPIAGYLSDHTLSRFGRRKPYAFFGLLGVFLCVMGMPYLSTFGIVAIVSGLMYFSLRVAETPYLSLLPDIIPPQQRSTASGVMNMIGSIGLISYFLISSQIWDNNPNAVFYIVALASFGFVLIAIVFIKEPDIQTIPTPETTGSLKNRILDYLKSIAEETNVMKFFAAEFFWWAGFWMISSFLTLFMVEELNIAQGRSLFVPMVFSIVATLFMLPIGMLGDRVSRKGIISCMLGFWALTGMSIGLSQNFQQALITVGITGIPFAAIMGIGYAYLLDLIPRERTAEFVGFSTLSIAAGQIFGPLGGGKLIDILGYRWLFPVAGLLMIVGLIILQFVRPRKT